MKRLIHVFCAVIIALAATSILAIAPNVGLARGGGGSTHFGGGERQLFCHYHPRVCGWRR